MNTPNPLQPQGSLPSKATSKIGFKILMILSIHVVVIGGLLLQGCSKDKATTPTSTTDTAATTNASPMSTTPDLTPALPPANATANTAAPLPPVNNPAPVTTPVSTPMTATTTPAAVVPTMPVAAPSATPGVAREYVIASGDTFDAIHKRNGVSIKALLEANPGVDPKKLQIGHKLQIPAGSAVASSTTASPALKTDSNGAMADASPAAAGDTTTYTVKAGDRLLKIAATHGTTVKAIQALNVMKTTAIRAGQKLKMPVMKVASAEVAPVSTPATGEKMPATTAN